MRSTRRRLALGGTSAFLLLFPSIGSATTYDINPEHSHVGFATQHIKGQFRTFRGMFTYVPGQPTQWRAQATVDVASIDTGVWARDHHLRTSDYFNTTAFPTSIFVSTRISDVTDHGFIMQGLFTLHGFTQPLRLYVRALPPALDPQGQALPRFAAITAINRHNFGLDWILALELAGSHMDPEVMIELEVEGRRPDQSAVSGTRYPSTTKP